MRILLTGGSSCGKSTWAEEFATRMPEPRYYIATMRPYDDECRAKIAKHREQRREKGFITIEKYTDLRSVVLPSRGTVLLECMCNLTANEMFDEQGNMRDAYDDIISGVLAVEAQCDVLIVVTNDVGSDNGAYSDETRRYIAALGRLNCALAKRFEHVLELVCGIPVPIKGGVL